MRSAPVVTRPHLYAALQRRLSREGGWYLLQEVGEGSAGGQRYTDVVAVQTFWSRGIRAEGYELKVDRRDWLRELKDPDKAERQAAHLDAFWLVSSAGVVQDSNEVPPPWGWLELTAGGTLQRRRTAARLHRTLRTQWPVHLTTALLRAAARAWERPGGAAVEQARAEGRAQGQEMAAGAAAHVTRDLERLRKQVETFERASGLQVQHGWDLPAVGEVVAALLYGPSAQERLVRQLTAGANELQSLLARVQAAIDGLRAVALVATKEKSA